MGGCKSVSIYSMGTENGVSPFLEFLVDELMGSEVTVVSGLMDGGVHKFAETKGLKYWWFNSANGIAEANYQIQIDQSNPDLIIFCEDWKLPILGVDPAKTLHINTEAISDGLKVSLCFVATTTKCSGPELFSTLIRHWDVAAPVHQNIRIGGVVVQMISTLTFVLNGVVRWDGVNHDSLQVPPGYTISFGKAYA